MMVALIFLFLNLVASPFKSKSRLEAENVALRHQLTMAKKTIPFNQTGISKLPIDKPVVYRIQSDGGKNNYTGVAQRGRAQERLEEHLPKGKDPIPGAKVQIE